MKIRAFVAVILAKQYWRLFNPAFSMHFAYFYNLSIKVPFFQILLKFLDVSACMTLYDDV